MRRAEFIRSFTTKAERGICYGRFDNISDIVFAACGSRYIFCCFADTFSENSKRHAKAQNPQNHNDCICCDTWSNCSGNYRVYGNDDACYNVYVRCGDERKNVQTAALRSYSGRYSCNGGAFWSYGLLSRALFHYFICGEWAVII